MNPYEPPAHHEIAKPLREQSPESRRRTWNIAWAVLIAVVFIIAGLSELELQRAKSKSVMRAQKSPEAKANRIQDAAQKAGSPRGFTTENFDWPAAPKTNGRNVQP